MFVCGVCLFIYFIFWRGHPSSALQSMLEAGASPCSPSCCCCCKHEAPKLASKRLRYSSSCSTSSVRNESALAKRLSRPSRWNIGDCDLCVCTAVLCIYVMLGSSSAQLKPSPWKLQRWCRYEYTALCACSTQPCTHGFRHAPVVDFKLGK